MDNTTFIRHRAIALGLVGFVVIALVEAPCLAADITWLAVSLIALGVVLTVILIALAWLIDIVWRRSDGDRATLRLFQSMHATGRYGGHMTRQAIEGTRDWLGIAPPVRNDPATVRARRAHERDQANTGSHNTLNVD